jgi:hypothetical protein
MKSRRILAGVAGLCLISLAVSSIAIASMAAFVQKTENSGGADGDVGLRNYYQKGDGSRLDPFIISKPMHFYNFSRLQSLGVYSDPTQPKYFQLGYDPTGGSNLKFYESDSSNTMINYLDMSAYDGTTAAKTIHPIGSEGFPFSGRFDGMNLQVSNLKVIGDAQDVGVFGYTSSSSVVKNVLFDQSQDEYGCIVQNKENDYLYLGDNEGSLKIINLRSKKIIKKISHKVNSIVFMENWNNKYIFIGDTTSIYVFDININQIISRYLSIFDTGIINNIKKIINEEYNFYLLCIAGDNNIIKLLY